MSCVGEFGVVVSICEVSGAGGSECCDSGG